ncbi:FadR/GntR family transcriptional regulator [Streptomyces sp. NPDC052309]|uniref:FadR/GntR family transcriptional regulator n=1 Tax=Streptomyces sp. NPDC052309 TaxID=3155421 RepID=UPI0034412F55
MASSTAAPGASDEIFRPVPTGRASAMIVGQIRDLIRSGTLPVGTRLPAERDLCERMNVSRLTLREALRALEVSGLIQIRAGAHGGAFVTAPDTDRAGQGLTDLLSTSGLSASQVTEARIALELGTVQHICERATEDDLRELRVLCDQAEEARELGSYTVDMSYSFHLRAVQASHNPAIGMIMGSIRDAVLMSMRAAHHEGKQGVEEHRAFVDAVGRRDAAEARRILAAHLQRTVDAVAGD